MDSVSLNISRFLYRIRYQLIIGSVAIACIVAYFTQFLPKSYTVKTSIYTGIVSGSSIIEGEDPNFNVVKNSFDNLINLVKAKSSVENVALKLFAVSLIYGDPKNDNQYITASNYRDLMKIVPQQVVELVDKSSVDKTVDNFRNMKKNGQQNFIYSLLNGNYKHYSFNDLEKVDIKRMQTSDLLEISYTSDDPGITTNTVKFFSEELLNSYNELRYNSLNDVIKYFEKEVARIKTILTDKENILTAYNVANSVINYDEQTKFIADALIKYEDRLEEAQRRYKASQALLASMEKQMDTRTKLFYTNKDFLKSLDDISSLNGKITDIELFTTAEAQENNKDLVDYNNKLRDKERHVSDISKKMDVYKYSKEGLAIADMAQNWISALIENTKTEAELEVLYKRREDFDEKYAHFSPVGTELKRRERDINVTESSYLEMLHALNLAILKKKNIQLTTSNLNTITPPSFPLNPNKSKRLLMVIASFIASFIFIILYKLLIEIIDRTLRDSQRAKRLTGLSAIGAFIGKSELRYRGYSKNWNRKAASYLVAKICDGLNTVGPSFVNIFSIDKGEGKSYVSRFIVDDFERLKLKVKNIVITEDMLEDKDYILAKDFATVIPQDEANKYDVVIIEYPELISNMIPKNLINQANINILVANACRVWKKCDDELLSHLKQMSPEANYKLVLNNSDRSDVEDFTGELASFASGGVLSRYFRHMGLTSKKESIN